MNNKRPDPKAAALLKIAAAKLGTSPEELDASIRSGDLSRSLGNMQGKEAAMLKTALSDPGTAEKLLNTPQAKALIEKLSKK